MTKIRISMYDDRAFAIDIKPAKPEEYAYTWNILRGLPEKKYVKRQLCYRVPATANNVQYLMDRFTEDEMEIDEDAKVFMEYQSLTEKTATRRAERRWKFLFEDKLSDDIDWVLPLDPYRHQLATADAIRDVEFFGLLLEQGTGKTAIMINEIVRSAQALDKGSLKVLLIVPKTLIGNWKKELAKCLPDGLSTWIQPISKGANGIFDLVMGTRAKAKLKIWLVNPERLKSLRDGMDQMTWDIVVVDESNTIKADRAKRTKESFRVAERAKRRFIMTGTIMANSVLDVWAQFQFIQPGCLGFDEFSTFKRYYGRYARMKDGVQWSKLVGYRNLEELKKRMAKHSFIVKKEQCLDLPPKSYVQVPVAMGELQSKLYEEMLEFAVANLSDAEVMEARASIAVLLRLNQITSGFIKTPEGDVVRIPGGEGKADACLDLIKNADGKVIVWCRFREDIRYLVERLDAIGIKSVQIHGGVKQDQRDENVDLFNGDNDIRVLVGDAGTGGVGLTLLGHPEQPCSTMIYYSNDWSLAEREQSEDRAHRIGQTLNLTIYDLVCEESIDERMVQNLLDKRNLSEMLKDVTTLREFLLEGRRTIQRIAGKNDTTTLRHLLCSTGITIPCELGKEDGCESYDHEDGPCPHCDGNPATASTEKLREFLRSETVIG